jgi:hypothetical protein
MAKHWLTADGRLDPVRLAHMKPFTGRQKATLGGWRIQEFTDASSAGQCKQVLASGEGLVLRGLAIGNKDVARLNCRIQRWISIDRLSSCSTLVRLSPTFAMALRAALSLTPSQCFQ